jgi:hypothetical protein
LPARDHGASEALGLWEPKRSLTLEAARRHTQMIVRLRKVLMALAGLMVIVLGVQFMGNSAATFDSPSATESVKMVGPRYSGRTADGLPFYLTADTATRTLARRDEVSLINPVLEFIRADGAASSFVMAETGTFDDINKELSLSGAVSLETDDGYSCQTTQAQIFAREKRIEGSEIISCSGAFGEVEGQAFEINDSYTEFVFKDGVGGTLYQDPAQRTDIDPSVPDKQNAFAFRGDDPIIVSANRAVYLRGTTDLYGTKKDETGSTSETISSDELAAPVTIKQGDAIITANQIQILRREATSETDGTLRLGEVNKIIASGKFRYVTPETDVGGDQGIYERDKSLITVTGNVRVTQPGGNVALTDRLIYNTTLETVRFSGQCQGQNCDGGGRTRFTLNSSR